MLPFTIGIRGTMNEATWIANLRALAIPGDKQYPIMKAVQKATLEGLDITINFTETIKTQHQVSLDTVFKGPAVRFAAVGLKG